jgi:hypothetical protein
MKHTRKYFTVTFVTDIYFGDEEYAIVIAKNEVEARKEMEALLGEHLIAMTVRLSSWAEKRLARHNDRIVIAI